MKKLALALIGATAAFTTAGAQRTEPCRECMEAKYWVVPERDYESTEGAPFFPETEMLDRERPDSFGVAFSGGGTRSAAATLGQLRGLHLNNWLPYVRYISAVSGGSWGAVPYIFTKDSIDDLLGQQLQPRELEWSKVSRKPNGELAKAISSSLMLSAGLKEALGMAAPSLLRRETINAVRQMMSALSAGRREPDRLDKTFARVIGSTFIDPLVENRDQKSSERLFSWNAATVREMSGMEMNRNRFPNDVVIAGDDRPFLIVGGTLVSLRRHYSYPLLIPIEYTPMYVGARQQFGGRMGGTLVWPWAYDTARVGTYGDGRIQVMYDEKHPFTLADVIASSGAAPQLMLLLGWNAPDAAKAAMQKSAQLFPAFRHFTVNGGGPAPLSGLMPHGDGGFSDNLGLMPLLARQVKNIFVFVNTMTPYVENNDDLKSFFFPVGPPGGSGSKTLNEAFPPEKYDELIKGLRQRRTAREAQVYCGRDWDVRKNAHYNVRAYNGVNICWFYNADVPAWRKQLAGGIAELFDRDNPNKEARKFDRFPWFDTFRQLRLDNGQVNLLAHMWAWTLTDPATGNMVREKLTVNLPEVRERPSRRD